MECEKLRWCSEIMSHRLDFHFFGNQRLVRLLGGAWRLISNYLLQEGKSELLIYPNSVPLQYKLHLLAGNSWLGSQAVVI